VTGVRAKAAQRIDAAAFGIIKSHLLVNGMTDAHDVAEDIIDALRHASLLKRPRTQGTPSHCKLCDRPLRPKSVPKAQRPDAFGHAGGGLCSACYKRADTPERLAALDANEIAFHDTFDRATPASSLGAKWIPSNSIPIITSTPETNTRERDEEGPPH
jgi:hypothetical protein